MPRSEGALVADCREYLDRRWKDVTEGFANGNLDDVLADEPTRQKIKACLTSQSKTYHYVLPTQVLAKIVDPSLDAHSLQAAWNATGSFDARTIAHEVIVPFDRHNFNVLGGSPEPYVNNPLRVNAIIASFRAQQKEKADWDKLIAVLDLVQGAPPDMVKQIFDQILIEIHRLLAEVSIAYPLPNRISLKSTHSLIHTFLGVRSSGDRLEAVCTALFRTIGRHFGLFDSVKREKVNTADTASGMAADIECLLSGRVVLLVEVKDRSLTLTQLDTKLTSARSKRISEILFIAEQGKDPSNETDIEGRIETEFTSGQNIYVSDFVDFSLGILILLGEKGRVDLLNEVGQELEESGAAIVHRRAWAALLRTV